jgi:hypothetical protein
MARNYAVTGSRSVASPTATLLGLTGATTCRTQLNDLIVGSAATPADNALRFLVQRYTAAGTSTSVTPQALDSGDPSSVTTAGVNHTAEPTYTSGANLIDIAMNQRATQRWVATPGREIRVPATAANGLGVQPIHPSFTGTVNATVHFEE